MRTGRALQWAAGQARRAIHADDLERLEQLLAEHPALLSYRDQAGATLLSYAAEAFGPTGDGREQVYTRRACAEALIAHGARLDPESWRNIVTMRSAGILQLLAAKGLLPPELRVHAALGDLAGVRASMSAAETSELHEACMDACAFGHAEVAALLLDVCIEREPELGARLDAGPGRQAFLSYLAEHDDRFGTHGDLWQSFVVSQLRSAIAGEDAAAFASWLEREPWLLGESCVARQIELIEYATYTDREAFIRRLLDASPALVRRRPPPPSAALEYAFEHGHASFVPLLASVWEVPDDLPHAAGAGDFERVQRWFDRDGRPLIGDLTHHYPLDNPTKLGHLHWNAGEVQHVLDCAFAWACLNHHFEIADFLLERGADIDTDWGTHEPASVLHECAVAQNYPAAKYLIARGVDQTLHDYRWDSTAEGWARFGAEDDAMADFLAAARRAAGDG